MFLIDPANHRLSIFATDAALTPAARSDDCQPDSTGLSDSPNP